MCHILATAYRFKQEQGWRRFDFPGGKVISFFLNIFLTIIFEIFFITICKEYLEFIKIYKTLKKYIYTKREKEKENN